MNRSWFHMHKKVSRKKYDIWLILFVFILLFLKKLFQSFSDSFGWFWYIFCWMLLACMQCDFHFNGIFNILIIHTYIYVIPHFQGMSFTFNVKKKVKKYIKQLNKTHIIWKNDFIACAARARGKVYIALILWKSVRKTKFNKKI